MSFREQVKQILRMCGHAVVSTVHGRLDTVEGMLRDALDQNTHIAQTQTALLQSSIHLVEALPQIRADVQQLQPLITSLISERSAAKAEVEALAREIYGLQRQVDSALATNIRALSEEIRLMILSLDTAVKNASEAGAQAREAGTALLESSLAGVRNLEQACSEGLHAANARLASMAPVADETRDFLANQAVRQVCVETSDYLATNPELGLVAFLYSHLQGRKALDIGANVGEVSEHLLKTGYEVYAFEPYPPSYERLTERLKNYPDFHAFNVAIAAVDGELPLHLATDSSNGQVFDDPTVFHSLAPHAMPEGLEFSDTVPVPVRRLADLHRRGDVPEEISLVKIDTEGYDLEVIRGMGAHRYPVITVEFWDTHIPFARNGLLYTMQSIVREMRDREYFWYIVLYRVWGQNQTAFFCNHDRPVPDSWGKIFFFRDPQTFAQAQQWCSAILPRTYFKSIAAR